MSVVVGFMLFILGFGLYCVLDNDEKGGVHDESGNNN